MSIDHTHFIYLKNQNGINLKMIKKDYQGQSGCSFV